ncbi:hypothetical protein ECC02_012587 [Trypanosoma cruzi]|uniref:Uncharacterized protein n=1 Tax=Trypanosoma cruzi TaxID=5693 RepID=A0A7J6XKR1_TRYCR|nr:hypothetical protein ECC02_012587 [Trypanosoma cruzi]
MYYFFPALLGSVAERVIPLNRSFPQVRYTRSPFHRCSRPQTARAGKRQGKQKEKEREKKKRRRSFLFFLLLFRRATRREEEDDDGRQKGGEKKERGGGENRLTRPKYKNKIKKQQQQQKKKMGKLEALEIEEAFSAGKCQTQPSPPNRHPSTLPQLLGVPSPSSLPSYIPFPKNVKRPPLPSSLFAALASAGKHTKEKSINQERKERERRGSGHSSTPPHPPRPPYPRTLRRPPRSPSPGRRDLHGPPRTHPPPYPHQRTSARTHACCT